MAARPPDEKPAGSASPRRPPWSSAEIILLAAVSLLLPLLVFIATPLNEHNGGRDADGVHYAAMADTLAADSADARAAPFCWRILTPWLASVLPLPPLASFRLLAGVASVLSLLLLYDVLRSMPTSPPVRFFGLLLYAGVFWALKFSFYSPFYIDAETQAFLLLVLSLMVRGRFLLIAILLPIAVLQKESLLALAPVVFAHYAADTTDERRRRLRLLAALVLPAIVALLIVRGAIEPSNSYSSARAFLGSIGQLRHVTVWPRFVAEIFSGLGILPAVLLLLASHARRFLLSHRSWALHLSIGAVLLFGGPEKARFFLFMLPGLIVVVADSLQSSAAATETRVLLWMTAVVLLQFYVGHHFTPMGTFADYRQRMVPIHSPESVLPSLVRGVTPNVLAFALGSLMLRGAMRARLARR